eukprot:scaffold14035_cov38-Tisochrysis_lutea.AAC.3
MPLLMVVTNTSAFPAAALCHVNPQVIARLLLPAMADGEPMHLSPLQQTDLLLVIANLPLLGTCGLVLGMASGMIPYYMQTTGCACLPATMRVRECPCMRWPVPLNLHHEWLALAQCAPRM